MAMRLLSRRCQRIAANCHWSFLFYFLTILLSPFKSIEMQQFFSFPQISTSAQAEYTIVTVSPHVEIPMGLTVVPVIIPPQEMEKHARILWHRVSVWHTSQA